MFLFRLYQTIKNQAMETFLIWRGIKPANMSKAGTANRDSPAIPWKPAEFFRCCTQVPTSGGLPKAANLKYNAIWIKKSMLVCSLNFNALCWAGNNGVTLGTQDMLFFLALFLVFFLHQLFSLTIRHRNAQEIETIRNCWLLTYHIIILP